MSIASPSTVIDATLDEFVRRRRRVRAAGLLCLAVAAALAWLIAGAVVDRVAQLPIWARSIVLGGFLLLLGSAIVRGLVLLLSKQFNRLIAARQIEAMEPTLRDALITVVSQDAMPQNQRASTAMIDLVRTGVSDHLAQSRPHRRMTLRHARPAIAVLVFVLATVLVLACIPWLGLPQLIMRQLFPLADIPPVTTTRIDVGTGSLDLPQGQSLSIVADVTRNEGPVTLLVGENREQLQPIAMARVFGDRYTVTLPSVERDLTYRVEAGDARSSHYAVRVLRRPGVAKLRVDLTFPTYVGKPPLSFDLQDGKIEAVRGTLVRLTVTSTEALRQATFDLPGGAVTAVETIDPYVRTAEFTIDKSGPWATQLISDRGVPGGSSAKQQIVAVEDRPPIVQFLRTDLRLHPSDVVAVLFQVIDDFGIDSLQLDVAGGGKTLLSRAMPLSRERQMVRDVVSVDLAPFALAYGDVVTLTLTAVDGAKQSRASTPPCRVLLSPRSVDPRVLRHIDALEDAKQLAESAVNRPADAALSLRAMLKAIATSEAPSTTDAIEASLDEMQQVVSRLSRQEKMTDGDKQLARNAAERLGALARGQQAKVAAAEIENIKSAEESKREQSPAERDATRQSLQRARADVSDRLKSLGIAENNETPARLNELTQRAENLGAKRPPIEQIAQQWTPAQSDQADVQRERIAMAAQAEVLRSDSDLAWARDLQLAARAMARQQQESAGDEGKSALQQAVKSVEQLHRAVRENQDRGALASNAEKARQSLRKLAGDTDAAAAEASKGSLERALEKPVKLQAQHDESSEQAEPAQKSDEPEKWQPPADNDGKSTPAAAEQRAQELNRLAKAQQQLAKRTESAAQEAAARLAGEQQQIAGDLQAAEKQVQEEDFFDRDQTPKREETLDAMRQAQRALSDLPQQVMQLREQAERVAQMKRAAEQAESEADGAPADQQAAAERNAAEAKRQLNEAQQQLGSAASAMTQSTSESLSASAGKMGAMGRPMKAAADGALGRSMQAIQQSLAAGDLPAADRDQSRLLDAIADLQGTLRVAQRKTVERDPLVAARFYAQRAAEALAQHPPNLVEARLYQKQTTAALEQAWDRAMNKAVKDRLAQLPSFRSLLMDDFIAPGTGEGDIRAAMDRSVAPQWGRLRENAGDNANAAGNAFVPAGYEESLRVYFQALDKARSTGGADRPSEGR